MRKINKLKVAKGCPNQEVFHFDSNLQKIEPNWDNALDYDMVPILEDLSQSETIIII